MMYYMWANVLTGGETSEKVIEVIFLIFWDTLLLN